MGPERRELASRGDAVDDAVFRALESLALRRAVLGLELQFHHDLLVDRAETMRLGSPFAWAIEASVLRSISAAVGVALAPDEVVDGADVRALELLSNDSMLEELGSLGPIGVLTRHLCRATCDAVEAASGDDEDTLAAYRSALESLSTSVWPCASALDDRPWGILRPELGRCRREVVEALRAGASPSQVAHLYREAWALKPA